MTQQLTRVVRKSGDNLHSTAKNHEENEASTKKSFNDLNPDSKNKPSPSGGPGGNGKGTGGGGNGKPGKNGPGIQSANRPPHENDTPTSKLPGCGDPIDISTGRMMLTHVDVDLAGVLPLVVERTHLSSYRVGRWFGQTWASTLDQRVEVEPNGVHFAAADGMLLSYPVPGGQGAVYPDLGPRWPLSRTEDGGYIIVDPESTQVRYFGPSGGEVLPISSIRDGNGNFIEFSYDEAGAPVAVRHSAGYYLSVVTDNGLVTSLLLWEPDGATELMSFAYDADRRLVEVVNPSGQVLRFEYDGAGRITRWTDRNGMWYAYVYGAEGRCVRTEGKDGYFSYSFAYDRENLVTVVTDSHGHTSTFELNSALQVIRETDPLGAITRYEWDRYDRLLAVVDPLGRTTRHEYNTSGHRTATTHADGTRSVTEYDARGLLTAVVEPDGAVWRYECDERGLVAAQVSPTGERRVFAHDAAGNLVASTDALGNTTRRTVNAAGQPVAVTDPRGATVRYSYDALGREETITDPLGGVVRHEWSTEGLLRARISADNSAEYWSYDGQGNVVESVDGRWQQTRFQVGHFDLPAATIGPDGTQLSYTYDTELRLITVTNEAGQVWRFEYDAADNLIEETDFNGRRMQYRYDLAGQMVQRVDATGHSTTYTYDALGRQIERRCGDRVTTFAYDAAGRLVYARNPDAELTYSYDAAGRVVSEQINDLAVLSDYDHAGRRVQRRTPTGAISRWEYDENDQPTVLRVAGQEIRFGHDAAGREVQRRTAADAALLQEWDAKHRLRGQTVLTRSGSQQWPRPTQHRTYGYFPDNSLAEVTDDIAGRRLFDLDPAGRVTAVHGPDWSERYAYSATGALTDAQWPAVQPAAAATVGARVHANHLLVQAGSVRYAHDAAGRMIRREVRDAEPAVWTLQWDTDSQLTSVDTPDGWHWTYHYDPLGRRIAKRRLRPDGTMVELVEFTWDGYQLAEQVHNGERALVWDWDPGQYALVSQTERAAIAGNTSGWVDQRFHLVVCDRVGSPAELLEADGTVAWQLRTTLWGNLSSPPGAAYTPLRFPGQYHDPETGLHYNLHRYYDPTTGRYTSNDPLGLAPAADPQSYVHNPTGWCDPLGLTKTTSCGGAGSSSTGSSGSGGGTPGPSAGAGGSGKAPAPPPPPPLPLRPKVPAHVIDHVEFGDLKKKKKFSGGHMWSNQVTAGPSGTHGSGIIGGDYPPGHVPQQFGPQSASDHAAGNTPHHKPQGMEVVHNPVTMDSSGKLYKKHGISGVLPPGIDSKTYGDMLQDASQKVANNPHKYMNPQKDAAGNFTGTSRWNSWAHVPPDLKNADGTPHPMAGQKMGFQGFADQDGNMLTGYPVDSLPPGVNP